MVLKMEYDPINPLPLEEDGGPENYLEVETLSMATKNYVESPILSIYRQRAVMVAYKYSRCENFDPVIPYLAMNYFDRYLSATPVIKAVTNTGQRDLELLALCCLTLAWKMRDPSFFLTEYLDEHPEINVVTHGQILTMELYIVKGIDWHLRPVTPLCYVPHLEGKLNTIYGFRRVRVRLCRPSVVAASAFLAASSFLYPSQFSGFVNQMSSDTFYGLFQEDIEACTNAMIDVCKELKLWIESAIQKGQFRPRRKIRAGVASQEFIEISENIDTSGRLKQVAAEPSHEVSSGTSKEGTSKLLPEQVVDEPSHEVSSGKSEDATSKLLPEQVAAEPSEEAGAEKSKEVADELSQEADPGKSENVASELLPERVSDERSQEGDARKSKKVTFILPGQVAAEPSQEDSPGKSKEVTSELPEDVANKPSEEAGAGKSEGTVELPEQVAAKTFDKSETEVVQTSEMSELQHAETSEKSKHDGAGTSKEAAETSIGVASNYGEKSSQRPGKEKVEEAELVVFPQTNVEPPIQDEEVQPNGPFQEFCGFCCKCCCDCCKLL
uniref:B-like cyclin n=1 Tax=Cannabis sativa TaxID=3483 RepID=A0A803QCR5_CANSA